MKNARATFPLLLLASASGILIGALLRQPTNSIDRQTVATAERIIAMSFTDAERDSMLDGLNNLLKNYASIRSIPIPNDIMPSLLFHPLPSGFKIAPGRSSFTMTSPGHVERPADLEELAFASIGQLSELIRTRKITSLDLTQMYLARLKRYGPKLECVITLTEELALRQARKLDEELARGIYRGPLHGIPYGAKDLLAVKGYTTTWGAMPYKDQVIDKDATVIKKLEEAGAVLVAKLTLGALAWGDVWFGGMTRNPWNLQQGSSGSSAGSASATAAGLVAFAIGSETWGSIVSPSTRCGTTGLRPTYGRISRYGAMALSWSMDKLGPIARSVEDCAIVFNAVYGPDGIDPTLYDAPFNYSPNVDLRTLRIGYLKMEFDSARVNKANNDSVLAVLRRLGANLIPIELPKMNVSDLSFILSAEAAAAFDELTRSRRDTLLVRQMKNAWPNTFRTARFIPAVEYIQANRLRTLLIQEMDRLMRTVDVYVTPSFGGDNLLLTNLTGHPCVVLPNGFDDAGSPTSITFQGRLFDEATLLAVAKKYQDATTHHKKHPPMEWSNR